MKLSLVCIPVIMAATLVAQPPAGAHDPAQRLTNMLTRFLGLSASVQGQVQTILSDAEALSKPINDELKPLRMSLTAAIKSNNTSQIDTLTLQISPLRQQLEDIHSKAAANVYSLLSADQQAKLGEGLGMLMGGGFGRGPGMRHGGPPPK